MLRPPPPSAPTALARSARLLVCPFALLPLLAGCSLLGAEEGTFEGLVAYGFEMSGFTPCDREEDWWVTGPASGELFERYTGVVEPGSEYAPAYARVRGEISRRGEYGHVGAYDREIEVLEVLEVRAADAAECR